MGFLGVDVFVVVKEVDVEVGGEFFLGCLIVVDVGD